MKTIRERLIHALKVAGAVPVEARTLRFTVLVTHTHPRTKEARTDYWFISKMGVLKVSSAPTIVSARYAHRTKAELLGIPYVAGTITT